MCRGFPARKTASKNVSNQVPVLVDKKSNHSIQNEPAIRTSTAKRASHPHLHCETRFVASSVLHFMTYGERKKRETNAQLIPLSSYSLRFRIIIDKVPLQVMSPSKTQRERELVSQDNLEVELVFNPTSRRFGRRSSGWNCCFHELLTPKIITSYSNLVVHSKW